MPTSVSLGVLREALLVVFDWSGECLHEFVIRGVGYSSDWLVDGIDTRTTNLGAPPGFRSRSMIYAACCDAR